MTSQPSQSVSQGELNPHTGPTGRVLQVDFAWGHCSYNVTELGKDTPLYIGKIQPLTMKTTFRTGPAFTGLATSATDAKHDGEVMGESEIGYFRPDSKCHIRGHPVRLSAAKKLLSRYKYPSMAYAPSADGSQVAMTWTSNSLFKCLDFDLFDNKQERVARFSTRYLHFRKTAVIEIFGLKGQEQLAVEEVMITGITLYLQMMYRMSSPIPLIGALISRPGKDYKVTDKELAAAEQKVLALDPAEFPPPKYDGKHDDSSSEEDVKEPIR
jgi:hypothetical protein